VTQPKQFLADGTRHNGGSREEKKKEKTTTTWSLT
jgi:hypothetical protein